MISKTFAFYFYLWYDQSTIILKMLIKEKYIEWNAKKEN